MILSTGKDAVLGLMARAKLLTGTKPIKLHRPSDQLSVRGTTYIKHGNWADVINDFNSISPTAVSTAFKVS